MDNPKRKNHFNILRCVMLVLLAGFLIGAYFLYGYYTKTFSPAVHISIEQEPFLYIPDSSTLNKVADSLMVNAFIDKREDFIWVAEKKNYQNHIYPGKYELKDGMSLNELVNLLRSGQQVMVHLTFNNVRFKTDLAGKVAPYIAADSLELLQKLNAPAYAAQYGFNENTFLSMFIPNTYEFYWNTNADEFFERMANEYKRFWTDERKTKARRMNMSQSEVATLASIVQNESNKKDESARIAGVYINRLKKSMLLQADPTVKFALGDFSIRRVLNKHKEVDSPYNTYMYKGLPPGPIALPEIHYMDAVLNYESHDYLYFCARDDFSGYHSFATNYRQHRLNAKKYWAALNKRGIYN